MRRGKLREVVLKIFEDGGEHTKEEIRQNLKNEVYTEKQLRDLLYNLVRENKIEKISKGMYCSHGGQCLQVTSVVKKDERQEIKSIFIQLEMMCYQLKNNLDAPGLLTRVKALPCSIEMLEKLYNLNEQMLDVIKEIKGDGF